MKSYLVVEYNLFRTIITNIIYTWWVLIIIVMMKLFFLQLHLIIIKLKWS